MLVILLPEKGNLKQCQNYRTVSLISNPSKIMLRIILSRLKAKAEELLAEELAGFRPGRSTVTDRQWSSHHAEAPTTPARSVPQLNKKKKTKKKKKKAPFLSKANSALQLMTTSTTHDAHVLQAHCHT